MCMHSWVWVQKFIHDYTGLLSSSPSSQWFLLIFPLHFPNTFLHSFYYCFLSGLSWGRTEEERKRSYLWSKGWMVVPWLGVDRIMLKDDRENSPHLPLSSLSSRMTLKLERVEQTWLRGNWNLRWVNWQYKAALKAFKLRWITSKGAGRNCRCGHRDAVLNSEGSGRMREPHDICFYKGKKLSSHSLTLLPG